MGLTDGVSARLQRAGLDPGYVEDVVRRALEEDLGEGLDVTSVATVPFEWEGRASFVTRAPGVVAGLPVVAAILEVATDDSVRSDGEVGDGDRVAPGQVLLEVRAQTRALLTAERTALNLLGRLSGIATLTRAWVAAVEGTGARIRDTRKTTPGLRPLEKYAVRCGGGLNHRMGLWDAALVKDNHVLAAGGVGPAFAAVRSAFPDLPLEVECDTVEEVRDAVAAGADLVLCDNMTSTALAEAVAEARGRARLEASGGLRLSSAREMAATGVDFLAVGALTHSAPALDVGLDLRDRAES